MVPSGPWEDVLCACLCVCVCLCGYPCVWGAADGVFPSTPALSLPDGSPCRAWSCALACVPGARRRRCWACSMTLKRGSRSRSSPGRLAPGGWGTLAPSSALWRPLRMLLSAPNKGSSVQFSLVQSLSHVQFFATHEPLHARPPCPSPTTRVYSNSCPLSRWCHPTISSSVVPFSSCPQSFPASGSFQMSQLFASGGQSTGVSASTSVLPKNIQDWSPLGCTGWLSLPSYWISIRNSPLCLLHQSGVGNWTEAAKGWSLEAVHSICRAQCPGLAEPPGGHQLSHWCLRFWPWPWTLALGIC